MDGELKTVQQLQSEGILLVEDGNHGENRPRPNEFEPYGKAFVRAADMLDGRVDFVKCERINRAASDRIRKGIGRPNDILLSHKGTVGKVARVGENAPDFVCSPQTTFWRVTNDKKLDRNYLYAFMRSPAFGEQLKAVQGETDMAPYVSLTAQRRLKIPIPNMFQQKAMGQLFGTLDDKIELNREMAQTLEETARALFRSWFVDFDPIRAKVESRSTGLPDAVASLFPKRLSPDGSPEGWASACLGDVVAELETGSRPKGGVSSYASGVPSIGAESIVGIGKFHFSKTKYVPEEFYASMSRGRIQDRDILLYKDGGKPGLFRPHVTMVGEGFPFDRAAINEHVYRIRAISGISQDFLFLALSSENCMEEMKRRGTGVAIPGLNSTQIRQVSLPAATSAVRSAFSRIVNPLLTRILVLSSESERLAHLRDSLLPKLISGELRIHDAERVVAAA